MKHYRHPITGEVFAFATDEERQQLGDEALVEMTEIEFQEHVEGFTRPEVPQVVTRFQARAALARASLFITVNDAMKALPEDDEQRLAWEDAQEFRRQSPTLLTMAATLGLNDEQLDSLFTVAAGIEA